MNRITAEEIADDLGYSLRYFKEKVSKGSGFPKRRRLGNKSWWDKQKYDSWKASNESIQ